MKFWIVMIVQLIVIAAVCGKMAGKAEAQTIIFQDNFNDNTIDDWQVVRSSQLGIPFFPCDYQNAPASWTPINGKLQIKIEGLPCITELIPRNFSLGPVTAYTYEFDWEMPETMEMDRNALWAWKDKDNWYNVKILGNLIKFEKMSNGSPGIILNRQTQYPLQPNTTYHFMITYTHNHEIILRINNVDILRSADMEPFIGTNWTVGFQAGVGNIPRTVSFFDNVVVKSLMPDSSTQLNVELFKQTDPRWKENEYDTAHKWSDRITIQRWGCAMTSAVMILRYHGIKLLADGQQLTPATLNEWLKSQKDGYFNEGHINWQAITRLSREMSATLKTPKLEYSRVAGTLSNAINEIKQRKPVILQMDGHFLVGDGVSADEKTVFIKDPSYSYTTWAQHKTALLSVRKFQPSYTDLSYFVISHQPGLNITLKNAAGQLITEFETFDEWLDDDVDPLATKSSTVTQHQLPKPESGTYQLEISSTLPQAYSFQFFSYDQAANVTDLSDSGFAGTSAIKYTFEYNKDGTPPTFNQVVDFLQLRQDIQLSHQLGHLKSYPVFLQLDRLANLGSLADQIKQQRYHDQIAAIIEKNQAAFTEVGLDHIRRQLSRMSFSL